MKALKPILFLCTAFCLVTACHKEVDMTLVQKTQFENAEIQQIEVSDAWQVTVVADNNTYVELEYSAYLEPYLKVKMEGSTLEIGFTGKVYAEPGSVFRATVHTNQLEKVEADDAAKITFNGVFNGAQLIVKLEDASVCTGLAFTGAHCEIDVQDASKLLDFQFDGLSCTAALHEASQFNGNIQATDQLDIELESASRFVNNGGETSVVNINLQEISLLNMVETQVNEMHVALSEGSEATVWVNELLEGTLIEASTLYYKGQPQLNVDCSDGSQLIPL